MNICQMGVWLICWRVTTKVFWICPLGIKLLWMLLRGFLICIMIVSLPLSRMWNPTTYWLMQSLWHKLQILELPKWLLESAKGHDQCLWLQDPMATLHQVCEIKLRIKFKFLNPVTQMLEFAFSKVNKCKFQWSMKNYRFIF